MQKIILMALVLILMAAPLAWCADPSGGAITVTQLSNTSVRMNIVTAPANIDTLYRCDFVAGATDTTFVALSDTTAASVTVTSMVPGEGHEYFLLVRGEDGDTAISNKVAFTMYGPETEYIPATANDKAAMDRTYKLTELVIGALSWRPDTLQESFTLVGETDRDSTAVYTPW